MADNTDREEEQSMFDMIRGPDDDQGLFSLSVGIVRHRFCLTNPKEIYSNYNAWMQSINKEKLNQS